MPVPYNIPLIFGGCLSGIAALLHLAIIAGGAKWYRFFGAGEAMARGAEQGRWYPPIVTAAIAGVLGVWAAYALSAAGVLRTAPFARPVLVTITVLYLLRGLVLIPVLLMPRTETTRFGIWSSAICLVFAAAHLAGLIQVWGRL